MTVNIISLPEPSGSHGELMIYPCSGVCHHRPSTIFSDDLQNHSAKFHVELPWEGGRKSMNGPGHMTKMAVMPIYGKNLQNQRSYDLENLACSIGD